MEIIISFFLFPLRIIAALNFLRYLLLRDSKKSDLTGIWSMLELIDKGYLSELITGLELSKMHYKQREEELVDEKKRGKFNIGFWQIFNVSFIIKQGVLSI